MRDLLCNFFYLLINAYICYFFWREPWLVATQRLRDKLDKNKQTFLFTQSKNLFIKMSFKLSSIAPSFVKRIFLKEVLKVRHINEPENDLLFSSLFLHVYTFWFFLLFSVWFLLSYVF
jgi:hypothetical protein